MIKNCKIAFTLAEVMVSLAIIGVMGAILIPILFDSRPKDNKVMFKKAYSIMNQNINVMLNDDNAYPSNLGFAYTTATVESGSNNKFCYYFKSYLNTIDSLTCPDTSFTSSSENPQFAQSSDGIKWYLHYNGGFSPTDYNVKLIVDVNGDRKPNCLVIKDASKCSNFTLTGHTCKSDYSACSAPDTFIIGIRADGKLKVGNCDYVDSDQILEPYDVDLLSDPLNNN